MMDKFDPKAESIRLVAKLQELKKPLAAEREKLQAEAKALKLAHEQKLAVLREKIRAAQQRIVPIDQELRNADGLKNLRGPLAEKVAAEINDALGE